MELHEKPFDIADDVIHGSCPAWVNYLATTAWLFSCLKRLKYYHTRVDSFCMYLTLDP